jgi:hypothetical protein
MEGRISTPTTMATERHSAALHWHAAGALSAAVPLGGPGMPAARRRAAFTQWLHYLGSITVPGSFIFRHGAIHPAETSDQLTSIGYIRVSRGLGCPDCVGMESSDLGLMSMRMVWGLRVTCRLLVVRTLWSLTAHWQPEHCDVADLRLRHGALFPGSHWQQRALAPSRCR